jgi:pimeloyl-ACP methyl ester carboxylesterase
LIESGNYKINYETEGEGRDVVILHGWGYDITLLERLKNALKDSYRVTLIDLPGHGKSSEPETPITVYDYADIVLDVLDKLKIESAFFIGHSFGCRLCVIIGAKYPEKIKKLVLCGAAGIREKRTAKYYFKVYTYKIGKFFLKTFAPKRFEKWRSTKGSEDYKKLSDTMKATFSNIVNEDLTYLLNKIQAPTFLIWGENDTATPLYMADIMEKNIPECYKAVYLGRTHYAFLEELPRTVAIIRTFFKE